MPSSASRRSPPKTPVADWPFAIARQLQLIEDGAWPQAIEAIAAGGWDCSEAGEFWPAAKDAMRRGASKSYGQDPTTETITALIDALSDCPTWKMERRNWVQSQSAKGCSELKTFWSLREADDFGDFSLPASPKSSSVAAAWAAELAGGGFTFDKKRVAVWFERFASRGADKLIDRADQREILNRWIGDAAGSLMESTPESMAEARERFALCVRGQLVNPSDFTPMLDRLMECSARSGRAGECAMAMVVLLGAEAASSPSWPKWLARAQSLAKSSAAADPAWLAFAGSVRSIEDARVLSLEIAHSASAATDGVGDGADAKLLDSRDAPRALRL